MVDRVSVLDVARATVLADGEIKLIVVRNTQQQVPRPFKAQVGIAVQQQHWTPTAFNELLGDLSAQVYDSLFDLEDALPLADYLDEHFGIDGPYESYRENVPYVRW